MTADQPHAAASALRLTVKLETEYTQEGRSSTHEKMALGLPGHLDLRPRASDDSSSSATLTLTVQPAHALKKGRKEAQLGARTPHAKASSVISKTRILRNHNTTCAPTVRNMDSTVEVRRFTAVRRSSYRNLRLEQPKGGATCRVCVPPLSLRACTHPFVHRACWLEELPRMTLWRPSPPP